MESLLEALKHAADGAYVIDDQQRITFWNKAAEAILGYSADEIIGRNCYQIFAGRDVAGCPICRWRCLPYVAGGRGEPVQTFDAHVRGKDGCSHWVSVTILAVPTATDLPHAIVHLVRNIDGQKQMESFVRDMLSQARQLDLHERRPMTPSGEESVPDQLTTREFQILDLLAQGTDTAAIAQKLIISETTVRNHIQHILHKLNVHSRLEAVAYAHEHNLL